MNEKNLSTTIDMKNSGSRKARTCRCGLKAQYVARRLPVMDVARKLEERPVSIPDFSSM